MPSLTFKEVVANEAVLMGVKAVWGRSSEPVMCFGSHGNPALKDKGHFSLAEATAAKALDRPFLVTIGGGDEVPDELRGRVLELVRVTGTYGETGAFVRDPDLRKRLERWPVAVVLLEVYSIDEEPHLVKELGFADKMILANAFDNVRRDDEQVAKLWEVLRDRRVSRQWAVQPLPGFRAPDKVQKFSSMYPKIRATTTEGRRILKESQQLERSAALSRTAKDLNQVKNGGLIVCEGCGLCDDLPGMFDAHHLHPLAAGIRESRPDDFAVLCPTCHRSAHAKGEDLLQPLTIAELRATRSLLVHRPL